MHDQVTTNAARTNLAPIPMECDAPFLKITGELPRELNGTLYRNGPNPQFDVPGAHWFVGDGMLHAFHLENGRASYRNRWVRTPKWQAEHDAGRALFGGFGRKLPGTPADVTTDGGVAPEDAGGNPDGASSPDATTEVDAGLDGGVAEVDTGIPDPDQDPDRDGIPSSVDKCPTVSDRDQRDFDGDGRGDLCDVCADTAPMSMVDAEGCPVLAAELRSILDRIAQAIVEGSFEAALDQNADGVIDARDFVLKARAGGAQ